MSPVSREHAIKRLKARREFSQLLGVTALVSVVTVAAWALTGAEYFWPMWPMLGLGIALLAAAWQAWGPAERDISEDEIQREMARE